MCVDFYALFRIVIDQLPAFNVLSRKIYVMFNTPFTFSYSLHEDKFFLCYYINFNERRRTKF